MSSTQPDVDRALAYLEPSASPFWHRHGGVKARPLTPAQQRRNRELLDLAQRSPRPRSPRSTKTSATCTCPPARTAPPSRPPCDWAATSSR
ncbi:hypothetical protein AB0M97_25320 [Streptomyces sp. NPDC051207]|uniref:hypothetical protein n=1 Tax=Streptomyces sp. NPDC051207 TaxID=3154641 RepID=UPI00342350D1